MATSYVGEIRMFGGSFAPVGWALCNGQTLPISENPTLFQLIGTMYGGDGVNTFGLPNLQSRLPLHFGTSPVDGGMYTLAQAAGEESVTLTTNQIPAHGHPLQATSTNASSTDPGGNLLAQTSQFDIYLQNTKSLEPMAPQAIATTGGNQPHDNMQPFLCVTFIISLFGIFPTQT